jgi:uncharacterized metal-binding protein YceD (DUF177 family)
VKKLVEYIIPFSGLKVGEHTFNYTVDKSFLEKFECEDIINVMLDITVKMIKNHRLLEFDFFLKGKATVECDRCLDEIDVPVDYHSQLLVKIEDIEEVEDEIIYIKPDESEIDISRFVYENIIFSIPPKRVHPEDKNGNSLCNPEMLKKLEAHLVKETDETDPRWNKLKNLLN